jgi:hypothetical protein
VSPLLRSLALAAALSALLAPLPAAASSTTDAELADLAREAFAPRRIAVLIAVEQVDDGSFPPLTFAGQDVQRLAGVLGDEEAGRFDEVEVLLQATRADLRAALTELMRTVRRQDTVLVYFSGHGLADTSSPPRLMLVMRDSTLGDIGGSGVALDTVQEVLQALPARRKVLLVDACFTAEGKRADVASARSSEDVAEAPLLRTELPADEAHLLAAGYGRPAFELPDLEGSLYTTHFVNGLEGLLADVDGDGVVTVSEAHDHAAAAAVDASEGLQVPLALYRISGREDLVLSGDPDLRSSPTLALLTTYDRRHAGLGVEIDGRAKGVFPRSIPVEPGVHNVQLTSSSGRVVDRGTYRFTSGQVVSAERMRSALNGGYRLLHVCLGVTVLPVPGGGGVKAMGPGVSAGFGHRARGVVGRHVVLRGDFGFASIPADEGGRWPAFSVGVEGALRFDPTPISLEIGVRAGLDLLVPSGGASTDSPALLMFTPGPHAAFGVRLGNLVTLKLHYRMGITHADLADRGSPETTVLHRPGAELELGW